MSGHEVLREIRRKWSSGALPVIMVTAKDGSEDVVEALALGANDIIVKPIDFPVALARIRTQVHRKQAEDRLRESEERYALATAGANDGLWDWKLAAGEIYYSDRWKALLGYEPRALTSSPEEWFGSVHEADRKRVRDGLDAHLAGRTTHLEVEYRMRHASGAYRWVLTRGLAVRDGAGRAVRLAGSFTDITDGKVADVLTSLPNRILFTDRLLWCIEYSRRHPEFSFGVLLVDLDGFKVINDGLGHLAGDRLLVDVARRLEHSVRASDAVGRAVAISGAGDSLQRTVARLGGDEFTILLPAIKDATDATRIAERVLDAVRQAFTVDDREVFISASVGIVVSRNGEASADEILRDADTALYRAKTLGKSRYEIFDEAMRNRVVARLNVESSLRRAVERRELRLHYQPLVTLDDDALVGFEALLRWQHPERGLVPPDVFIPIAEETGLIVPIGRWVLREACRQLAEWRDGGCDIGRFRMSVNVSSREFQQPDLVAYIRQVLDDFVLNGRHLEIEITESTAMENADAVVGRLADLKATGVSISIDDFGTGHSSLAYLHRFPIDRLRIDRTFVARLLAHGDEDATPIVRAILALAQQIDVVTVAEGIQTVDERDCLRALGCAMGQGYLYSRPDYAAEAVGMLRSRSGYANASPAGR
jgi:PAS domain S-box-containing protein